MAHSQVQNDQVRAALDAVMDPELGRSLVAAGMIHGIVIDGGHVTFTLELTTPACPLRNTLRDAAAAAVRGIPGVTDVHVDVTARVRNARTSTLLPEVRNIVAVASGKGGVGKSTLAANLAVALARTGAGVGLLDLDIYGPSIPRLFGLHETPIRQHESGQIHPFLRHGVQLMSVGCFVEADTPVIWRGPKVAGMVQHLLRDIAWGPLDYLIVDLPPGTGDAQLSLVQHVPLSGVVIVTTAQDAALRIALHALRLFVTLHVPIFGLVENMSTFVCPHCQTPTPVFGPEGMVESEAARLHVPFLGRIPLNATIVLDGDRGIPSVEATPGSPQAIAFQTIARAIAAQASITALRSICHPS